MGKSFISGQNIIDLFKIEPVDLVKLCHGLKLQAYEKTLLRPIVDIETTEIIPIYPPNNTDSYIYWKPAGFFNNLKDFSCVWEWPLNSEVNIELKERFKNFKEDMSDYIKTLMAREFFYILNRNCSPTFTGLCLQRYTVIEFLFDVHFYPIFLDSWVSKPNANIIYTNNCIDAVMTMKFEYSQVLTVLGIPKVQNIPEISDSVELCEIILTTSKSTNGEDGLPDDLDELKTYITNNPGDKKALIKTIALFKIKQVLGAKEKYIDAFSMRLDGKNLELIFSTLGNTTKKDPKYLNKRGKEYVDKGKKIIEYILGLDIDKELLNPTNRKYTKPKNFKPNSKAVSASNKVKPKK